MILDNKLSKQEIIVLDGAIGSEIARLGGAMDAAARCVVANKTHPEVVRRVHEEYIAPVRMWSQPTPSRLVATF